MSPRTSPAPSTPVRHRALARRGRLPRAATAALAALAALALACGGPGDGGGDSPDPEPGDTLAINPSLARLEVVNAAPATQAFTVELVKPSGARFDVTDRVRWTLSDPLVGSFSGAVFTARGGSAGLSTATATLDTVAGDATIEVFVRGVRVGPGAPPNAPDLFATGTLDPAQAPELAYPPDQAIVPRNLGDLEVHWRTSFGHDLYELSMVNEHVDLKLYVGGSGATGWAAFASGEWYAAAMGGRSITVGLRALVTASPGAHGAAPPRTLGLTNNDLEGGLYYWAATAAGGAPYGIFRHDFGNPGQPAEPFYTTTEAGRCVACHALSRDGERMTVVWDGGDGSSTLLDVSSRTPMIPHQQQYWNFAAYSPDAARLVTSRQGTLTVRDGATGLPIGATVPTAGFATHPDFSPLGNLLVYTRAAANPGANDWHFTGGEIMGVAYDPVNDAWGTPTPIITGGGNNFYPSVSPDGQWVLFNRSSEDAYDDASAELWVARIDGSGARKLDLANVGPGLTNSWARWAPFQATYGAPGATEDLYWITWSSKRDFGVRLVGAGRPQLWMSPFFPGRVAGGGDPTAPAFRLPFQDLASNNHIAQWTEVVVPIGRMQVTPIAAAPGAALTP
ncbi:MAG: PD40 domain-containing protein [Myxococcales bacterium]|nr:PD40 domain-containing protein [Myxococcales bacterium]